MTKSYEEFVIEVDESFKAFREETLKARAAFREEAERQKADFDRLRTISLESRPRARSHREIYESWTS